MQITAKTSDEFKIQFKQLLESPMYSKDIGIIYYLTTSNPIPRVLGESSIIYIGKSEKSYKSRYSNSKSFNIEVSYFENIYKKIIEVYGPITVEIKKVENPKHEEWRALENYYRTHLEHPPTNRSIPSKPVDIKE